MDGSPARGTTSSASAVVTAAAVVTTDAVVRPGWVAFSGERITAVAGGDPPAAPTVAFPDAVLVPGFVDIHCHGGGGAAFSSGDAQEALRAVRLHREHGTTTVVGSLMTAAPATLTRSLRALRELVQDDVLAGLHLEGPWLAAARAGAHDPALLRDPDPHEVAAVVAAGDGAIRMVTVAPELTGALAAVRSLVDAGVVAAVGHTDATYEQTRQAVDAGARVATHLFNAMRPVHHRDPGPVVALLEDERVALELVVDGVHLHPALYRHVSTTAPHRVVLVTDATPATGMPEGSYRLGEQRVDVTGRRACLAGTTTLAGSTATMDEVFRLALAASGLPLDVALVQAVRQASASPAAALGLHEVGQLAAGAFADLVVLDQAFSVTAVLRRGEWLTGQPGSTPSAAAPGLW